MEEDSISVRVNTLKSTPSNAKVLLHKQFPECIVRDVSWYKDAFMLSNISREAFMKSELVLNGLLYPQNLSSMIPALVLSPMPGERILDLCAAPGSKTTQLFALMRGEGQIVANDSSRVRLFKLRAVLERCGASDVCTHHGAGETLWRKREISCKEERFSPLCGFDRVLVDAPCSMDQVYTQKRLRPLVSLQKKLLRSAFSLVRVGGVVVYSTCTKDPREGEEVIAYTLKKHPDMRRDSFFIPEGEFWFSYSEGMLRIPARERFGSFFVARCVRTGEIDSD